MRSQFTHILLTGGTGYIGGSVLSRLLSHSLSDIFQITVLVRDAAKARRFKTLGVKAVVGSNSDHALLRQLAREADVVIACADADDLGAAQAILDGLHDRFKKTGTAPSLIHTSGTGVLVDDAKGLHSSSNVYSDLDIRKIESLPLSQPHREVDVALVNADKAGYVKTYIVLPGTIYGVAEGPLVDMELQNPHSQQVPALVKIAIERGESGIVGAGKNIWPHVHIEEVVDLYTLIFEHIQARKPLAHGAQGYFFAEHGEYVMNDLAKAIASALHSQGKVKSKTPTTFTGEEMDRYFPGGTMFGTNSRCKAERSRSIGWRPRKGLSDLLASVKEEIPA